jgi:arylsulfatase A-like enzyme
VSALARLAAALLALGCACARPEPTLEVRGRLAGEPARPTAPPLQATKRHLDTASRDALPAAEAFVVELAPGDAELAFSTGVASSASCRVPVLFRIEADAGRGWEPLFQATHAAAVRRWQDHRAGPLASVKRLRFSSSVRWPDPARAQTCAPQVEPLWGSVLLLGAQRDPRPNIVLISLDTLGAAYLGAFEGPPGVSPTLDAFLDSGFSFRRAFAQYGVTRTSHASLFTALYPPGHGAYPYDAVLPLPSLVAQLARDGYRTAAVTEGGFVSGALGFHRGFDAYDDGTADALDPAASSDVDETLRRARAWLRGAGTRSRFFLFLHTYEVHVPYLPRDAPAQELARRLGAGDAAGLGPQRQPRLIIGHNDGSLTLEPQTREVLRALHLGEIQYLDRAIGRFLAELERMGLADDTLVVLTADHGEQFGEHGKMGHGESLHNRVLHVPLALRWPGHIRPGASDTVVQLVDVMPTILDLAGSEIPPGLDGRSLLPALEGRTLEPRPAFAELREARGECRRLGRPDRCRLERYAVQTGRFKLVRSGEPPRDVLYDLEGDPLETHDASAQHPEALARHRALLAGYLRDAPKHEPRPFTLDAELRERLRRLGYIE